MQNVAQEIGVLLKAGAEPYRLKGDLLPSSKNLTPPRKVQIKCPSCDWVHTGRDRWRCDMTCLMIFDTFVTGGRCPECRREWRSTVCPKCLRWHPHDSYYQEA